MFSDLMTIIQLPPVLTQFLMTVLLSFIIGLELHSYRRAAEQDLGFGTTRTFTLIGVLGFVLYILDSNAVLYLTGLCVLTLLLGIYYHHRTGEQLYSLINPLLALLTYLLAPVVILMPNWFTILYVVTLLLLLGEKPGIRRFSDTFRSTEMVTLAKFMIMAGVVLPLLPGKQIAPFITVTYYQVWLAVLVVSTLSYLSYLSQNYLFKEKGLLLTGLLGGLYSSTATTIVLAKRARQLPASPQITQALMMTTAMMYLRLWILVMLLGHASMGWQLLLPFAAIFVATALVSWLVNTTAHSVMAKAEKQSLTNPLEFKTALFFAMLFIIFAGITTLILARYGNRGLQFLSFVVGLSDIDPFILSLLSGDFAVTDTQISHAIMIAAGSNNLMKAVYMLVLERNRYTLIAAAWLVILCLFSLLYVWL